MRLSSRRARRQQQARKANRVGLAPSMDLLEARQLLSMTVEVMEVGTENSVIISDNGPNDIDPASGAITYKPSVSPFPDFTITSISATSNRLTATTQAFLTQSGQVTRSTTTGGAKTLQITVTDTDYLRPLALASLGASSNVTFTNPTALDSSSFQASANGTLSPVLTLTPTPGKPTSTVNANAAPTALSDSSPFTLSSTYTITLGPSQSGNSATSVTYQDTGLSYVRGTNPLSSLSGNVFTDLNHDLLHNLPGEQGLPSVPVTLTGSDLFGNSVTLTTTTDSTGAYSFPNLQPSDLNGYTVTEGATPGYIHEGQVVGSTGGITGTRTITTILPVGVDSIENNFVEEQPVTIAGTVYWDKDASGALNSGDVGINGVTVTLKDGSGNVVNTTTTAADGTYSFSTDSKGQLLTAGTYTVVETQPAGYLQGTNTVGTVNGSPDGSLTATDVIGQVVLTPSQNGINYNFGEVKPVTIAGTVYWDKDTSGTLNSGDVGINGVTVTLKDGSGNVVNTTTTAADGTYSFSTDSGGNYLPAGTYSVTETQPAGYAQGTNTVGTVNGTPDGSLTATDVIGKVVLAQGDNGIQYNFGEVKTGSITGTKFLDVTGNGLSADDPALLGVPMTFKLYRDVDKNGQLTSADGAAIQTTSLDTTTGTYAFSGLSDGKYLVQEVVPKGYIRTAPVFADYQSVVVVTGQNTGGADFANFQQPAACPTNITYYINGCGPYSDLRGRVPQGATVEAHFDAPAGKSVTVSLVSYTAPDSYFNAADASQQQIFQLATGTYTGKNNVLKVVVPNGYFQVDFVCGKAIDQLGPEGSNIFYTPQGRLHSADNGGCSPVTTSSLSGYVYVDANNDGSFQSSETPISGVTIRLTGKDVYGNPVVVPDAVTDSRGYYHFDNLPASDANGYTLSEVPPSGYLDGKDTIGSQGGSSPSNDVLVTGFLNTNTNGKNNNFGEQLSTSSGCNTVCGGDTGTIDFWNCKDGQNLIKCLDGGSRSKDLGNWLSSCFPNLFGRYSGNNLCGKTNSDIASYFQSCYNQRSKTSAQVLATALSAYVTDSDLGGSAGKSYGFNVSKTGCGTSTYNVGSNGSSLGLSKYGSYSVLDLLQQADKQTGRNQFNDSAFCNVFSGINSTGDCNYGGSNNNDQGGSNWGWGGWGGWGGW